MEKYLLEVSEAILTATVVACGPGQHGDPAALMARRLHHSVLLKLFLLKEPTHPILGPAYPKFQHLSASFDKGIFSWVLGNFVLVLLLPLTSCRGLDKSIPGILVMGLTSVSGSSLRGDS